MKNIQNQIYIITLALYIVVVKSFYTRCSSDEQNILCCFLKGFFIFPYSHHFRIGLIRPDPPYIFIFAPFIFPYLPSSLPFFCPRLILFVSFSPILSGYPSLLYFAMPRAAAGAFAPCFALLSSITSPMLL